MIAEDLMRKYKGLHYPKEFARFVEKSTVVEKRHYLNGVGSPSGGWVRWVIYHLTPDTIWGLNVRRVASIHDFRYTYPKYFATWTLALIYKDLADDELFQNLVTCIRAHTKWKWLLKLRLHRAKFYHKMVQENGSESFFNDKIIAEEVFEK